MTKNYVELGFTNLINKKSEGFDRIPVCSLLDAREPLLNPMAGLFSKIYTTGVIHRKSPKSFQPIKREAKTKLKITDQ